MNMRFTSVDASVRVCASSSLFSIRPHRLVRAHSSIRPSVPSLTRSICFAWSRRSALYRKRRKNALICIMSKREKKRGGLLERASALCVFMIVRFLSRWPQFFFFLSWSSSARLALLLLASARNTKTTSTSPQNPMIGGKISSFLDAFMCG